MTTAPPNWTDIVRANPALADAGFAGKTARWNTLKAAADRLGLDDTTAAAFIAYGMTDGAEGALPAGVAAAELEAALHATVDAGGA